MWLVANTLGTARLHKVDEYPTGRRRHSGGTGGAGVISGRLNSSGLGSASTGEAGSLQVAAISLQDFRPAVDERIAESTYLTLFPEALDESPFPILAATGCRPVRRILTTYPPGGPETGSACLMSPLRPSSPQCPAWCRCTVRCWTQSQDLPVRVLLTVGRGLDVARPEVAPRNVRIERGVTAHVAAAAQPSIDRDDAATPRTAMLQVLGDPGYASPGAEIRAANSDLPLFEDTYAKLIPGEPSA